MVNPTGSSYRFRPHKPRRAKNLKGDDWAPYKNDIAHYHAIGYTREVIIKRLKDDYRFVVTSVHPCLLSNPAVAPAVLTMATDPLS